MDRLPYDLIMKIALEINPLNLINLASVCRKLRRLGNDETFFRKLLNKFFLDYIPGLPHWEFKPFPTFKALFIRLSLVVRQITTKIHNHYGLQYSHYTNIDDNRSLCKLGANALLTIMYESHYGRLK